MPGCPAHNTHIILYRRAVHDNGHVINVIKVCKKYTKKRIKRNNNRKKKQLIKIHATLVIDGFTGKRERERKIEIEWEREP